MKIIIIITTFFSSFVFAQELITKHNFENIQYVEDIDWYYDEIYCSGYSFNTKINDGNATDAYLIRYDENLNPIWTLKISEEQTNIIYSFKRHNNKIYALVTQGNIKPLEQDVFISLFIISLDGKIEDKVNFGKTFHSPSNIEFVGDDLIFGNKVSNGVTYASSSVSEIIKYNIKTKNISRYKSDQYLSRPKKIIVYKSNIFLFGIYLHKNQPNILAYINGKYSEISLNVTKEEYFLDSYINNNILTVVCLFPGTYQDKEQYLKIYSYNIVDKSIKFKKMSYADLGWSDQKFDTFTVTEGSWLIMKNNITKELNFELLNKDLKKIKAIKYDSNNGNGNWDRFIFKNGFLLNANSKGIMLYKIVIY